MIKDKSNYSILIIEDNPGDLFIFQEYLRDQILNPTIVSAHSFEEASKILKDDTQKFDIVFLDLSLPDKKGATLIHEILKIGKKVPIVVLTGYSDIQFSIESLHLGVSDYLIKDELTALALYKSLRYNIERGKYLVQLEQSEKRYIDLFHLSPQPMWIYDIDTLKFLDVNDAATKHYGYSYEEFLDMTILEIRPKEEIPTLNKVLQSMPLNHSGKIKGFYKHQKKDGTVIEVEITSNLVSRVGKTVRIILANDVTDRVQYIKAIIDQNEKLKEIAWVQSHVVRAPLARLMGLVKILDGGNDVPEKDKNFIYKELLNSADELDDIIRDISDKASKIEINNTDYDFGDITGR
ncbi:response regulator [Cellulophaga baltica]|uniref:PAS domain S-box-containing protein n=2 Tax=Cellulophaga baltica TaxID=76594 RepID=A0A1G7D3Y0_9FLAO|nr:response regulator [Cellulophaga baltica]AIZ41351.1 histidine kinase [Cellulophaga baltica 18]SDE46312.1 PAS domain S-box-containing protein [Cellulophaga baltica]